MRQKMHISFTNNSKIQQVTAGALSAILFCSMLGVLLVIVHHVLLWVYNYNGSIGGVFGFLVGCSLCARSEILTIIDKTKKENNFKSIPIKSVSCVITLFTIAYLVTVYFLILK